MRHMTKLLISSLLILVALMTVGPVNAASVEPTPANPTVTQSQIFSISIDGLDFPATTGGDVLIQWDETLLSLILPVDYSGSPFDLNSNSTPGPGDVSLSFAQFISPPAAGTFALADLQFQASSVNTGVSNFTLTPSFWSDATGIEFPVQPSIFNGTVTVNAVPIPPTVLLLGAGLVGLVGIRRRVRS